LAHHLQRLILLGWWLAGAYAADFSHALHLKLMPQCASCHPKAATSTKMEDNLLPGAQVCASCHKQVSIKAPRRTRLVKFDHAFHLKMGNIAPVLKAAVQSKTYLGDAAAVAPYLDTRNACAACHHGIEQSTSVAADSKALYPQMADCLVCHNKIDAPFSCETCHGQDRTLKPAFHTADYLDAHTRKTVVKQGCAVCHGRKFTCLGCH
jgi:hypothetical protein